MMMMYCILERDMRGSANARAIWLSLVRVLGTIPGDYVARNGFNKPAFRKCYNFKFTRTAVQLALGIIGMQFCFFLLEIMGFKMEVCKLPKKLMTN